VEGSFFLDAQDAQDAHPLFKGFPKERPGRTKDALRTHKYIYSLLKGNGEYIFGAWGLFFLPPFHRLQALYGCALGASEIDKDIPDKDS
jgi:hypothetical protein